MPQEFYKYVKRSADRFIELGLSDTVEVTKFDVERYNSAQRAFTSADCSNRYIRLILGLVSY